MRLSTIPQINLDLARLLFSIPLETTHLTSKDKDAQTYWKESILTVSPDALHLLPVIRMKALPGWRSPYHHLPKVIN